MSERDLFDELFEVGEKIGTAVGEGLLMLGRALLDPDYPDGSDTEPKRTTTGAKPSAPREAGPAGSGPRQPRPGQPGGPSTDRKPTPYIGGRVTNAEGAARLEVGAAMRTTQPIPPQHKHLVASKVQPSGEGGSTFWEVTGRPELFDDAEVAALGGTWTVVATGPAA